jgi:peptidoglycan/xylan/chitin deacetylase (PgdA/CDA1 family)
MESATTVPVANRLLPFPRGPSKRERIARFCSRAGLTRLLETAPRAASLLILAYHRIGRPEESAYDDSLYSATSEELDEQIAYLKSRFHVASPEEVRQLVLRPAGWRHSAVLLTFDDGYLDNYTSAFPVLRSHDLAAIFFLATSFVGAHHLPWWDGIAYLIKRTTRKRVLLRQPLPIDLDLSSGEVGPAIRKAIELYKCPLTTNTSLFLTHLAEACGVDLPAECPERLFLDWTEAAEMVRRGMMVGSHTRRHNLLAKLSAAEEYDELAGSRSILERRLGTNVTAIAYPVGSNASFSARTRANAERAGYTLGFSFYGGLNLPSDLRRFDLRRTNVGQDLSFPLFRLQTTLSTVAGRRFFSGAGRDGETGR